MKARIITKPLSTWLNSYKDYHSQRKNIPPHSTLTPLTPDPQNPKTSTNQNNSQTPATTDLKANQAIQDWGLGKKQIAPNRNRLIWGSTREKWTRTVDWKCIGLQSCKITLPASFTANVSSHFVHHFAANTLQNWWLNLIFRDQPVGQTKLSMRKYWNLGVIFHH